MNLFRPTLFSFQNLLTLGKDNLVVGILFLAQFIFLLDFTIMIPMGSQLMRIFNLTAGEFSLLISAYTFSAAVSGMVASFFIDKINRKKLFMLVYSGFVVGTSCTAFSINFETLLISRCLTGCFGGVIGSLILALLNDLVSPEKRGKTTGIVMSSVSFVSILGVPFSLFLASKFFWNLPFNIVSLLSAMVLLLVQYFLPSSKQSELPKKGKDKEVKIVKLIRTENWSFLLMAMLMVGGGFSVFPFISTYLVHNAGVPESEISVIFLIGGCCTALSGPFVGRLSDLIGKRKVFGYISTASIIPVFLVTLLPYESGILAYCMMALFFILMNARYIAATSYISSSVVSERRGKFLSRCYSFQQLAGAFTAASIGQLLISNPTGAFSNFHYAGIIAVIATVICVFISFRIKSSGIN